MGANTSKFSSLILTFFFHSKSSVFWLHINIKLQGLHTVLLTVLLSVLHTVHWETKWCFASNFLIRPEGNSCNLGWLLIWMHVDTPAISCVRWLCTKAQRKHTEKLPARYNKLPMLVSSRKWHFKVRVQLGKKYLWSRFQTSCVTGKTTVKTQVSLLW